MSTTTPNTENRNGVRPRYIALGVDGEDAHHVYRTSDDVVFAITADGDVERREELTRSVDVWMELVRDARGWQHQGYYADLGRMVDDRLGGIQ